MTQVSINSPFLILNVTTPKPLRGKVVGEVQYLALPPVLTCSRSIQCSNVKPMTYVRPMLTANKNVSAKLTDLFVL
jgi:hypothetical protein